jgi:hypothetical protein
MTGPHLETALTPSAGEGLGVRAVLTEGLGVSSEQTDATGLVDRLSAVRRLEFPKDITEMFFDRFFADKKVLTNFAIGKSG